MENDKEKTITFKAWYICLTASLYPFYAFIQMNSLNVYGPHFIQQGSITLGELGILSASYIYADAIFLLPAGILLDKFSTRTLLLTCLSLSALGAALMAISQQFPVIECARIIAGIGHSFALLGCFHLVAQWFPARKQGFLIGLILTIALLGGLVAQSPSELLIERFGIHTVLWLNVILGLLIGVIIWIILPIKTTHSKTEMPTSQLWEGLKTAWCNSQNWLCGFYTCFLGLPLMLLGAVWGSTYLMTTKHLTALQASWITSSIFLGTIIGSSLVGWISDTLQLRRLPMVTGAIGCLVLLLVALFTHGLPVSLLIILFFLLSISASTQVLGFPTIAESNPTKNRSTAMGFSNVIIVGGTATFQLFFGALWASVELRKYAIITLLMALIISIILALLIKETLGNRTNSSFE
ncbi:MAG TPA: MFS transporter [Gammaproteobacteria bacterium]|nr:MFS transporter [Gammaproteobacteria bacterium]HVY53305.1 MFS transporter [Gammaproteobacteria bacterium]